MSDDKQDNLRSKPEQDRSPRIPPPGRWAEAMDELIEEAMRAGAFDNLSGKGKPLKLHMNPYSPGTELAYQLLKDNNYTLPWIRDRQEIFVVIDSLREEIGREWTRYHSEYRVAQGEMIRLSLSLEWQRKQVAWENKIQLINDQISELNLKQPLEILEVLKLTLAGELKRAGASSELA
jgi:DnaJ family protein C protein 28